MGERAPSGRCTLLRPHVWQLLAAAPAVLGEAVSNLLEPWPLIAVADGVPMTPSPAICAARCIRTSRGLSLAFHENKQTRDLLSRATSPR